MEENKTIVVLPIVLTFTRKKYEREKLEAMSDKEKYNTALKDRENCKIWKIADYVKQLNDCKPMDMCYTYIVGTPVTVDRNAVLK